VTAIFHLFSQPNRFLAVVCDPGAKCLAITTIVPAVVGIHAVAVVLSLAGALTVTNFPPELSAAAGVPALDTLL